MNAPLPAGLPRHAARRVAAVAAMLALLTAVACIALAHPAAAAPSHPYNKGCKALAAGDLVKATAFFERAVKLAPADTDALNNLAVCYIESGQFDRAEPLLAKVLRLNAKYRGADLNIGAGYVVSGEPDSGRDSTMKATDSPPTPNGKIVESAAYFNLGLIEADAGDYAKAQTDLEKSLTVMPGAETDVALGCVQCAQGDYDQGIASFEKASGQQPDQDLADAIATNLSAAYYQRGMVKLEDGDVSGAKADFTASKGQLENDYAEMGLALVSAEQGDTGVAKDTLTDLEKTADDPKLAEAAAVNLARVQDMGGGGGTGDATGDGETGWISWLVLIGGGVLFAVQTYAVMRAAAVRPRGPLAVPMAALGTVVGIATAAVFALAYFGNLDNTTYVLAALGVDVVVVALTWAAPSLGRGAARTA
jgi:tetratricopeptide (TPR) repeat protein